MTTGILSLQGNFLDHARSLELIKKDYKLIKQKSDLKNLDSLKAFVPEKFWFLRIYTPQV